MKLSERVINNLKERRDRLLNGDINSIPSPFKRFRDDLVGIEQAKFYMVTSKTKGGKTQFASNFFIYNSILYAYYNPEQVRVKIFYYPLEETPENIMERFMCYLLYTLSGNKYRINPKDLRSTNNDKPLPLEILELLESEQYKEIIQFFEDSIIFSTSTNATGVYKECKAYAEANGKVHTKKCKITDELGQVKEVDGFDYYEPNDPKEYKLIFYDHISLISLERNMDLRQSMSKLSEYFVLLRNRYGFTPIVIQQQAFHENIDAFKMDKLKPSLVTLADNKAIARDVDICLGIFSPYSYELREYMGYSIEKFKDNIRFLEVIINRSGQSNGMIALYFDGAVNYWKELPLPNDSNALQTIYNWMDKTKKNMLFFINSFKRMLNKQYYKK